MKKVKQATNPEMIKDFIKYNKQKNLTLADKYNSFIETDSVIDELLEDGESFVYRSFCNVGDSLSAIGNREEPLYKIIEDRLSIRREISESTEKNTITLKRLRDKSFCKEKDMLDMIMSDVAAENPTLIGLYLHLMYLDLSEIESHSDFESMLRSYQVSDDIWRLAILDIMRLYHADELECGQSSNWRKFIEDRIPELYTFAAFEACLRQIVIDCNEYEEYANCALDNHSKDILKKVYQEKEKVSKLIKQAEKKVKIIEHDNNKNDTISKLQKALEEKDRTIAQLNNKISELNEENRELKTAVTTLKKQHNPDETLQSRINTLNGIIANKDAQIESLEGGGILKTEKIDLFPGEQYEFVMSILSQLSEKLNKESRAYEIVMSLLNNNKAPSNGKEILEKLDSILSGKMELNKSDISKLEALGFNITRGGKHLKLNFRNSKYVYTISLTPSDYRTSVHRYVDISKCLAISTKL